MSLNLRFLFNRLYQVLQHKFCECALPSTGARDNFVVHHLKITLKGINKYDVDNVLICIHRLYNSYYTCSC